MKQNMLVDLLDSDRTFTVKRSDQAWRASDKTQKRAVNEKNSDASMC